MRTVVSTFSFKPNFQDKRDKNRVQVAKLRKQVQKVIVTLDEIAKEDLQYVKDSLVLNDDDELFE